MSSGFDDCTITTRKVFPLDTTEDLKNHNPKMEARGMKADNGKPSVGLIPREFIEGVAMAFDYGAKKYGRHNYRQGLQVSRTLDAAMRHLIAFNDGENDDPESGLNHLYHAAASIAMCLYSLDHHPGLDDRFKAE